VYPESLAIKHLSQYFLQDNIIPNHFTMKLSTSLAIILVQATTLCLAAALPVSVDTGLLEKRCLLKREICGENIDCCSGNCAIFNDAGVCA
jgi:hypothetical protein